jgi:type VI secretion system secreted protein Hcp
MATNMYIQFEDPNTDRIEILSWSHGFVQPTSATRSQSGGGTVEQATHQNLSFTKYLDNNSSVLLKACWSGRQMRKAILTCYRAGSDNKPVKYLTITMEYVIVANCSISGGPGDIPVINVSLDYGIVKYDYITQGQSDSATHNLITRSVE